MYISLRTTIQSLRPLGTGFVPLLFHSVSLTRKLSFVCVCVMQFLLSKHSDIVW